MAFSHHSLSLSLSLRKFSGKHLRQSFHPNIPMETPSSTRRITRSQALAASNTNSIPTSKKIEDSEKGTVPKSRQRTGSQPLIDITNDSPIIGIAMGKLKTPSSASSLSKNGGNKHQAKTPGSGEALLRGQVKTLLQRVEEEAEFSKKLSLEGRPFLHLQSPAGLLAPTPANTPQILSLSGEEYFKSFCLASVTPSPVQEELMISQMVSELFDGSNKQEGPESERSCLITRSLLLDFSDKSEGSSDSSGRSSVLSPEGEGESREKSSTEDDDASVWSIQAIASSTKDEEEEEEEVDDCVEDIGEENNGDDYDYEEEEEYGDDGGLLDALCEGMSKISVYGGDIREMANFAGRHTRFVYNSDDELIEGEEEYVLKLKGLPTPKGKHFRFPLEMEEGEGN